MVGGRSPLAHDERLYRFEFPERPGALMRFLSHMHTDWNISLFHYRNQGADYGRVLVGLQVPERDDAAFTRSSKPSGIPTRTRRATRCTGCSCADSADQSDGRRAARPELEAEAFDRFGRADAPPEQVAPVDEDDARTRACASRTSASWRVRERVRLARAARTRSGSSVATSSSVTSG